MIRAVELRAWVRDLGFPIVVASVLLYALVAMLPARLDKLTEAVEASTRKLERIEGALWQLLDDNRRK